MRIGYLLLSAVLVVGGCVKKRDHPRVATGFDSLVLTYDVGFEPTKRIWIGHRSDGKVLAEVSVETQEAIERPHQPTRVTVSRIELKKIEVPKAVFERVAAAFEDPKWIRAAGRARLVVDGSSYKFSRQTGTRLVEFTFDPEESSASDRVLVYALRDEFLSAVGLSWPIPEKPNKSPEPTPTAVTPRATEQKAK